MGFPVNLDFSASFVKMCIARKMVFQPTYETLIADRGREKV